MRLDVRVDPQLFMVTSEEDLLPMPSLGWTHRDHRDDVWVPSEYQMMCYYSAVRRTTTTIVGSFAPWCNSVRKKNIHTAHTHHGGAVLHSSLA